MKLKSIFLLTAVALLIASPVQANYWAISLGNAAYDTSAFDAPFDSGLEESDTALGVAFGLTSGNIFAMEFGYTDFGEAAGTIYSESGTLPVVTFPTYEYSEQASIKATALQVSAVSNIRFSEMAALMLTIGFERWDASGNYSYMFSDSTGYEESGVLTDSSDNGVDLFYGVGLALSLSERIGLSVVYDLHDFNTDLLDKIKISQTKAMLSFNL
jgi:opacity protein-like surface antigen